MNKRMLINIGNSHTHIVIKEDKVTVYDKKLSTKSLHLIDAEESVVSFSGQVFIASVVPSASKTLKSFLLSSRIVEPSWEDLKSFINFDQVDPTSVGIDRLLNVLAAIETQQTPAMIFDCGTAITSEIVLANRAFVGGAIIPGRKLQREALHQFTAKLPKTELTKELPQPYGQTTVEAINVSDLVLVNGVKSLIETTEEKIGCKLSIYAVGGDADYFFSNHPGCTILSEDLTLKGLEIYAEICSK